jgi:putative colanic acid biosynthesis acetyltransferase WcaF
MTNESPELYVNTLGFRNIAGRFLWTVAWRLLFRTSPRPCFGWRRFLLRRFGARLAATANVYPSVRVWAPWNLQMAADTCLADEVDCYCVAAVVLEEGVTVSQRAFLCTAGHDIHDRRRPLVAEPIRLEVDSWVFAEAFVGPGVTVRRGGVVAARAVVVRDVDECAIVAGNPGRVVGQRSRRALPHSPGATDA